MSLFSIGMPGTPVGEGAFEAQIGVGVFPPKSKKVGDENSADLPTL